ncbi:hypothetical protein [Rhizobium halophytocola]|uniref:Uncharacterized protein n=1 Tax=Rhizobium halophytocola TaxID=735519 RepID=A0ABS4E6L7_9HYPH|nr:hypothetical protein [Rhizobium halophytocola]MBP1853591.1 hypothetical protein [Rhizobium halophytocola]
MGNPAAWIDVLGLRVAQARVRQSQMLQDDIGYNVSPLSTDQYSAVGRAGTYITDRKALTDVLGKSIDGVISADAKTIAVLERNLGLEPGSLQQGFKIREAKGIRARNPRSPLPGGAGNNQYFLGAGEHLPGGGPEMLIDSIPTTDAAGVKTIGIVTAK